MSSGRARRSAVGGAADAAGSSYRAAVAAVIAAHALRGWDVRGFELPPGQAVPDDLRIETDDPVDDLGCALRGGGHAYLQAKRSLILSPQPDGPFAKAVAQCREAVVTADLDPERDRLAIVTARPNGSVRALSEALRRRRRGELAGAPTAREAEALEVLEGMLEDLEDADRRRLLDCLVIWECDCEERDADQAERASILLDGAIVPYGSGERAFETLKAHAYDLARHRDGADVEDLVEVLRANELELIGGADGAPALHLLARTAAAAAYRQRLQRDGQTIRLLGLGADLPNLPLADLDADVEAMEPDSGEERLAGRPLSLLVRRRGRLLLTGLPGSGKSTGLRKAAAEQASVPDAPLPVFVDLNQFAKRVETGSTLDALVEIAAREATGEEREALEEELAAAIGTGRATLYLDALDETRAMKTKVVEALDRFVAEQDDSLELVVATRDSGALAGRALGFREARLVAPEDVKETVKAILRAFAVHRKVESPREWVRVRQEWVERALQRDRELGTTPLMPILLAVSAAGHDEEDTLPSGRAEILRGVVRDVVDQWEARRLESGSLRLGALSGRRAAEALFGCFTVEGDVLAGESLPSREKALGEIAAYLQDQWGLPPGDAEATAYEAVEFWDEAGFFLRVENDLLEARVKLFSEIASALRWTKAEPEELRSWIGRTLSDPERAESSKLAAGLSSPAAQALVEEAVAEGALRGLQTAAEAIGEGAEIGREHLESLSLSLLRVVEQGGQQGVDAAGALAEIPVPADLQGRALTHFAEHLPADHALVAQVRAGVRWDREQDEELLRQLHQVLETEQPKRIESPAGQPGVLEFLTVDSRWAEAVVAAAEILVPRSRAEAELAATQINNVALVHGGRITEILFAAGYGDLVEREMEKQTQAMRPRFDWEKRMKRSHEAEVAVLREIARQGEPRDLSLRERRGLGDLVDFFHTLGIPESTGGEHEVLALDIPEALDLFVGAVAELGDFDLGATAAEAQLVLAEYQEDERAPVSRLLYMPGDGRRLTGWSTVSDPERLRDDLIRLLGGVRFAANIAAKALAYAPPALEVASSMRKKMPEHDLWRRRLAAAVVLNALPRAEGIGLAGEWLKTEDPFARRAAARFAAFHIEQEPEARALVRGALADEDAEVRDDALMVLQGKALDSELKEWIEAAPAGARGWRCERCGHENSRVGRACDECHVVGPELERHVTELLSE